MLEAEPLEGWISIKEAATILKVAPQAVHQMCENGVIPSTALRRVGNPKPIFLLSLLFTMGLAEERRAAAEERAELAAAKERNKARRRAANKPQLEFLTAEPEQTLPWCPECMHQHHTIEPCR